MKHHNVAPVLIGLFLPCAAIAQESSLDVQSDQQANTSAGALVNRVDANDEKMIEHRQDVFNETVDVLQPEIVVSALRKDQLIQKAPAAVTVISNIEIERQQILDVRSIQALVPSARFSAANTSTRIFIRGIGSTLDFYWIPEFVAVNINDSYVPRFATIGGFYDLASVEVLPGPQGVLYGRSAGGGAVIINTARPKNDFEAKVGVELGNYDFGRVEGMINLPLSPEVAVRGAFYISNRGGYQPFGLQSDESMSFRLSGTLQPTDDTDIFLWGSYFKQSGKPTSTVYVPFQDPAKPWFVPRSDPVTGTSNVTDNSLNYNYYLTGIEIIHQLDNFTIKANASFLQQKELAQRRLVGNRQLIDNTQKQYSGSLSLEGSIASIDIISGVDWSETRSSQDSRFGLRQLGTIFPRIQQSSVSGYLQLTRALGPGTRGVLGARYTIDDLAVEGTGIACFGPCVFPPINFRKQWKNIDLKVALEKDISPDAMVYGNIQTGYAPGTLNTFADATGLDKEVKPQSLLAYTAGLKTSFFNNNYIFNIEGFHYNYNDLIIQSFLASVGQLTLFNAPKSKVSGFQINSTIKITQNDTITASAAFTHGRYGSFKPTNNSIDIGGLQMVYTPTLTSSIRYVKAFDIADSHRVEASLQGYYSSSYWATFNHSSNARQGNYYKIDASVTLISSNDNYNIGLWAKNIGNRAVRTAIASSGYPSPYSAASLLEAPRTIGITFNKRFQ